MCFVGCVGVGIGPGMYSTVGLAGFSCGYSSMSWYTSCGSCVFTFSPISCRSSAVIGQSCV